MADQSDRKSIIGEVRISRWTLGLREVILAIIVGVLFLLCFILAGVLNNSKERLANLPSASAVVGKHYCTDVTCMRVAHRAVSLINKSVDPCDNFYQFACGNYAKFRMEQDPRSNNKASYVDHEVMGDTRDRVLSALELPISAKHDFPTDRKLKTFLSLCTDMSAREKQKGLPIVQKIIPALGGWKVLGTWNAASWDLNTALKKVQNEFWVNALYKPRVRDSNGGVTSKIIRLDEVWANKFFPTRYLDKDPRSVKMVQDYKAFIRRVGSYLVRDAKNLQDPPQGNSSKTEKLLDEFVNDTYTMEYKIAHLAHGDPQIGSEYRDMMTFGLQMSLRNLSLAADGVIDWVAQISHLFNQSTISDSTRVLVYNKKYFVALGIYLKSQPEQKMKRILHNYLIWKVAETYIKDLSWEYIHANKEVDLHLYGYGYFAGIDKYCLRLCERYMPEAIDNFVIRQILSKENKATAHEITDTIRQALEEQLKSSLFMDEATKKYAVEKLNRIRFTIGYPDWLANQTEVDNMYRSLKVNYSDFFGALMGINKFERLRMNKELQQTEKLRRKWSMGIFHSYPDYFHYKNRIYVFAGLLQFPYYDANQPHSASFGGLGFLVGETLQFLFGKWGSHVDKNGHRQRETWWSESTTKKFTGVKQCVENVLSNVSETVLHPDNTWRQLQIDASRYAENFMPYTNGMKLALQAYHDWTKKKGLDERRIPGLHMTNDQMLFLAHAQISCAVENPKSRYYQLRDGNLLYDNELRVNQALGQMEEFSESFHCKTGARMNHKKKCQMY